MKREEIKSIFPDVTDEQINSILDINGKDIQKFRDKVEKLQEKFDEKAESYDELKTKYDDLETQAESNNDWKQKYDDLKAENDGKEKAEKINKRFVECVGNKKFTHSTVKIDYLKKFSEALEKEENKCKSDKEIFENLVKGDERAFESNSFSKITGGGKHNTTGKSGKYNTREEIINIDDVEVRQSEILSHPDLFPEFKQKE